MKAKLVTVMVLAVLAACNKGNGDSDSEEVAVLTPAQQQAVDRINANLETLRGYTDLCEIGYIQSRMIWCDEILESATTLQGVAGAGSTAAEATEYCQHAFPITVLNACFDQVQAATRGPVDTTSLEPTRCSEASTLFDRIPATAQESPDVVAARGRYRDICQLALRVAQIDGVLNQEPPGCMQAEYLLNEVVDAAVREDPQIVERRQRHASLCQTMLTPP